MEPSIVANNIRLTQRLQNYVEKKTAKLDRYMPDLTDVRVDLSTRSAKSAADRHTAQVTVKDSRGMILRAEESTSDIFSSIDAVIDKLYRQISRYRGRMRDRRKAAPANEIFLGEPLPVEEEELPDVEGAIMRRKRFVLRPMAADEAIDQMELLGHTFYVFFNPDGEGVNVVYKRVDGGYGLIEPVVG